MDYERDQWLWWRHPAYALFKLGISPDKVGWYKSIKERTYFWQKLNSLLEEYGESPSFKKLIDLLVSMTGVQCEKVLWSRYHDNLSVLKGGILFEDIYGEELSRLYNDISK